MTGSPFPTDEEIPDLLVGPDSASWRFGSDARLYLVMLYPLLLQVAHPVVGAGVRDYSDFDKRPWARLVSTLDYVTMLIYGGEDAIAMGRRLRALHKQFTGVRECSERVAFCRELPDRFAQSVPQGARRKQAEFG